ncbi:hypothetical protein BC830DRAFT_1116739 [Chytriomyces sp. MP71]|nr:hypothetical protein BC830DRAFT_1116739 [Chytriomyces sp. MP71]
MASELCSYALSAAIQESVACGQAPSRALLDSCVCTSLDPESIHAFCENDDISEWQSEYDSYVNQRVKSCQAANLTVTSHSILSTPTNLLTGITASSSVSPSNSVQMPIPLNGSCMSSPMQLPFTRCATGLRCLCTEHGVDTCSGTCQPSAGTSTLSSPFSTRDGSSGRQSTTSQTSNLFTTLSLSPPSHATSSVIPSETTSSTSLWSASPGPILPIPGSTGVSSPSSGNSSNNLTRPSLSSATRFVHGVSGPLLFVLFLL